MIVDVVGEYGVCVVLCVCCDLVFYICSSGCLVSCVLDMDICSG